MSLFGLFRPHRRWRALAEAYADGELPRADTQRVEAHLSGCDACRAQVESARAVRRLLAAAPLEPAPRSFRLTPAMVAPEAQAPRRTSGARAVTLMRASQALAGVAVLAFAFFVVVDLSGSTGDTSDDDAFIGAAADTAERMAAPEDGAEETPAAANGGAPAPMDVDAQDAPAGGETVLALRDAGSPPESDGGPGALRIAQLAAAVLALAGLAGYLAARRVGKEERG